MSLPSEYFDALYKTSNDPWSFETRWYEQRKYAITTASLPLLRYANALEIGCSVGVLTEMLAKRCDRLLAIDTSATALERAKQRNLPSSVELEQLSIPGQWPKGHFDLIVFSEVGYYLSEADFETVIKRMTTSLANGGHLVAVHWRQQVADYPSNGERVHDRLRTSPLFSHLGHYEDEFFLLDLFGLPESALIGPD